MNRAGAYGSVLLGCAFAAEASAEAALFAATPLFDVQPSWKWVIGAALVALIIGFAIGWHTLDRRIRKKYGGLKIY